MSHTSLPRITIGLLPAAIVSAFSDRRDLLVGTLADGAAAVSGALLTDLQRLTRSEQRALLGNGELFQRLRQFLAGNAGYSPVDVIGVAPAPTGLPATAAVKLTGAATAPGTIKVSPVDAVQFTVDVPISIGHTADVVAAALVAAFDAIADKPFTAAATAGDVELTATDKGTPGNLYGIAVSGSTPGITVTLDAWLGGANDPSVTAVFDAVGATRYTGISWPEYLAPNLAIVKDFLQARFNPANSIQDGVAFVGRSLTYVEALAAVAAENSQCIVQGGNNRISTAAHKGPAILQPADWTLAYLMGVRSKRLTPNAPLASNVQATAGSLDAIGGPALASLPLFNTPLPSAPVGLPGLLYSEQEQGDLQRAGFSTFGSNLESSGTVAGEITTNWKTDASGNESPSFHFLEYVDTGSVCREVFWRTLRSTFAQSRLTEGALIPGRSIANAALILAEILRIYRELANLALVVAGSEAEDYFSANTQVLIDMSSGRATVRGPLPIVTQLRTIDYLLQFDFTVGTREA
ncbi:hypothetical protein [Lysobacter sp. GCM10012299]|uniref:hypothetical protein n=1 Tax=Lysobacter sp. GCM10012299 TaxID=3317333 RepID=UPI00361D06E0